MWHLRIKSKTQIVQVHPMFVIELTKYIVGLVFGPKILRSSDESSLIWDITSIPRGVESPF